MIQGILSSRTHPLFDSSSGPFGTRRSLSRSIEEADGYSSLPHYRSFAPSGLSHTLEVKSAACLYWNGDKLRIDSHESTNLFSRLNVLLGQSPTTSIRAAICQKERANPVLVSPEFRQLYEKPVNLTVERI